MQPEYKKMCVDPQLTSYEMLQNLLARAFDITSYVWNSTTTNNNSNNKNVAFLKINVLAIYLQQIWAVIWGWWQTFSSLPQLSVWISCSLDFRSRSLKFKDILFSVSLPLISCPLCLEYLPPCALILQRLWCNISHITYLLSVLALLCPTSFWELAALCTVLLCLVLCSVVYHSFESFIFIQSVMLFIQRVGWWEGLNYQFGKH